MMPPSGLPPLRQNSVNFAGVRKAAAVRGRIFEVAVAMGESLSIVRLGVRRARIGPSCYRPSTARRRAGDFMRHQSGQQGCRAGSRHDTVPVPARRMHSGPPGRSIVDENRACGWSRLLRGQARRQSSCFSLSVLKSRCPVLRCQRFIKPKGLLSSWTKRPAPSTKFEGRG